MVSITPGDKGGVSSRIKDISLEQFPPLSFALVPSVSRKENIFPTLATRTFGQVIVVIFDCFVPSLALTLFPSRVYDGNTCFDTWPFLHSPFTRIYRAQCRFRCYLAHFWRHRAKWHDVRERTVLKTVQFDLSAVELFKPDIAILQLGTNHLSHLPVANVGSAIKELTQSLHVSLNDKCVCVGQTIYCTGAPTFNQNVILLIGI